MRGQAERGARLLPSSPEPLPTHTHAHLALGLAAIVSLSARGSQQEGELAWVGTFGKVWRHSGL